MIVSGTVKIIDVKDIIDLDNCFSFVVQKIYHSENQIIIAMQTYYLRKEKKHYIIQYFETIINQIIKNI